MNAGLCRVVVPRLTVVGDSGIAGVISYPEEGVLGGFPSRLDGGRRSAVRE